MLRQAAFWGTLLTSVLAAGALWAGDDLAAEEADRLGLTLGLNLCSGWNAGGPWITPEYASQRLYWSETRVEGPRRFDAELPVPAGLVVRGGRQLYCDDVTVLAYPLGDLNPFEMKSASPQITASSAYQGYEVQKAIDGDLGSFWVSNGYDLGEGPTPDHPEWLEVQFPDPFPAASLLVVGREKWGPRDCDLQVSRDGRDFHTVCRFVVEDGRAATVEFNEVTSRVFRLLMTSSYDAGKPGYDLYAGTHFNPRITWWEQGVAFTEYLARCQYLLRQGLFVADVCYYCGEQRLAFAHYGPPRSGFDFDVINPHALVTRAGVKDGRIVLPDGMSYRLLVLPQDRTMSPDVLRKITELVEAGATVVGPKPERAPGLTDYPQCDEEVKKLAEQLWGEVDGQAIQERRVGQGRIIWNQTPAEILAGDGVPPDFQYDSVAQDAHLDFIHRTCDTAEIYFVSNQKDRPEAAECVFRVPGKQPEIWDPVTAERRDATDWRVEGGRTAVPLEFAPRQSWFVVFRRDASPPSQPVPNSPTLETAQELSGPWTVCFDPDWGGPEQAVFEKLEDWTSRPEQGIKHYSGTARYEKTFDLPEAVRESGKRLYLDLGDVKNVAEVRLNGKHLGVVWTAPWHVEITEAVQPTQNRLEIDVVNLWPNRLIGDAALPPEQRFTVTNVTRFKEDSPLLPSGLLGPVTVQVVH